MKQLKKTNWAALVLIFAFFMVTAGLTGCKKDLNQSGGDYDKSSKASLLRRAPIHLSGVITTNTRLTKNNLYYLDGIVYVTNNAKLYIEGGTNIVTGTKDANNIAGVLVITKGAQILADGNRANDTEGNYRADSTIVFGPDPAVALPVPGDFGGVIVLGDAPTNQPTTTTIEGIPTSPPADVTYGGTDINDNSGVIRNVRIEYPGHELSPANEINGLTLGGVGKGTKLSHIQVSYSNDDSFEFFGGTVDGDHLVALAGIDDDFDFDFGYSGTIQYAISLKNTEGNHTTSGGSSDANGIESDNNGTSPFTGTPLTKPVLKNFTVLGFATSANANLLEKANHWRRLSQLDIQNSILAGYNTGIQFEGITTSGSVFSSNVVQAYVTASTTTTSNPATYSLVDFLQSSANANIYLKLASAGAFFDESTYNPLNLRPLSTSPAYTGGVGGTTYRGAIDPAATASTIWTRNWTNFNP